MVKQEERWWVSAYSFEARPDFDAEILARGMTDMESSYPTRLERAKLFAAGLQSGRFSSYDEAFDGWVEFMISGEWP